MIIHGGVPLKGAVSVSGSKNATLPILMASLLTNEPVQHSQRAASARRRYRARAAAPASGCKPRGPGPHQSGAAGRAGHLARGAVRSGQDHARVVLRAGATARPRQTRQGLHSRWMRDRRASGESPHDGHSRARRARAVAQRLCRGARRPAAGRAHLARQSFGRRDREHHDGGGAGRRKNHHRECGARARSAGPREIPGRDGRQCARRRHPRHRDRRRRRSCTARNTK